jgi:hypothetical protein
MALTYGFLRRRWFQFLLAVSTLKADMLAVNCFEVLTLICLFAKFRQFSEVILLVKGFIP